MAAAKKSRAQKPRLRKAPTLREQAELVRSGKTEKKASRLRNLGTKSSTFLKKTRFTNNPLVLILARAGRLALKFLRLLVPNYLINSFREVRLVTWPSRRETWRLTGAVFIFAIVFGALVAGVDKVLDLIFKKVVLK